MAGACTDYLVDEPSTSQPFDNQSDSKEMIKTAISTSNIKLELNSDEKMSECDECEKACSSSDDLKTQFEFQCDECSCIFKTKMSLNTHMLTHEKRRKPDEKKPTKSKGCKLCDYNCSSKFNLANHFISKHTIMEPFQCDYPDCQFTTHLEKYLKRHKQHAHELEKRFKCDKCELSFHTENILQTHSFVHKKNKPFKCEKCQFSCTSNCKLQLHIQRKHVNEKEHKCDECGNSYDVKEELEKHKINHNDTMKNFKCNECPYSTFNEANLRDHLRNHKDDGRYKCDKCDRSFNRAKFLKNHQFTHTKDQTFRCGECNYSTYSPRNLKRHLLIKSHSVSNADGDK